MHEVNSLVYDRNIVGSSSKFFDNFRQPLEIFGNFRKMFGNVRVTFGQVLENLQKSSESDRRSSKNRKTRCHHVCVFSIITQVNIEILALSLAENGVIFL